MQMGIKNEYDFAKIIDGKTLNLLPFNIQEMLIAIFENIDLNTKIECWKSKYYEKADLKIKINNVIKGISIKTGHNCTVHQEHVSKFYSFLLKIGLPSHSIEIFQKFMAGYVNDKRVDARTYIDNNLKDIMYLKSLLDDYYIRANLIMRFLFQGTEIQNYSCDAIIYGTPQNFIWATRNEIFKYLLEYPKANENNLKIGALSIKSYDRNLNNNPERIKYQNIIQVKWLTLENDLTFLTKLRDANNYKYLTTVTTYKNY